jgi:hypothetical protein
MTIGPDSDRPTSAQFDHCVKIYNAMHERAKTEVITDSEGNEQSVLVYTGHLTRLFQQLMMAVPYYTSIMSTLKRLGCVEQIRRGGGSAPSKWALIGEPTEEAFNSLKPRSRKSASRVDAQQQQINDMNRRLLAVEQAVGTVRAS